MKNLFKEYIAGFILFFTSIFLMGISIGFGIGYTILSFIFRFSFKGLLKRVNRLFLQMAVGVDQLGNVIMQELFNTILIKKESIDKFGSEDETISSVIGKNQKTNTLTKVGNGLNWILNKIDPNHSLNSIEFGKRIGMKV